MWPFLLHSKQLLASSCFSLTNIPQLKFLADRIEIF